MRGGAGHWGRAPRVDAGADAPTRLHQLAAWHTGGVPTGGVTCHPAIIRRPSAGGRRPARPVGAQPSGRLRQQGCGGSQQARGDTPAAVHHHNHHRPPPPAATPTHPSSDLRHSCSRCQPAGRFCRSCPQPPVITSTRSSMRSAHRWGGRGLSDSSYSAASILYTLTSRPPSALPIMRAASGGGRAVRLVPKVISSAASSRERAGAAAGCSGGRQRCNPASSWQPGALSQLPARTPQKPGAVGGEPGPLHLYSNQPTIAATITPLVAGPCPDSAAELNLAVAARVPVPQ